MVIRTTANNTGTQTTKSLRNLVVQVQNKYTYNYQRIAYSNTIYCSNVSHAPNPHNPRFIIWDLRSCVPKTNPKRMASYQQRDRCYRCCNSLPDMTPDTTRYCANCHEPQPSEIDLPRETRATIERWRCQIFNIMPMTLRPDQSKPAIHIAEVSKRRAET